MCHVSGTRISGVYAASSLAVKPVTVRFTVKRLFSFSSTFTQPVSVTTQPVYSFDGRSRQLMYFTKLTCYEFLYENVDPESYFHLTHC